MIGEQLGNWRIVKKISRGGMADVFLAEEINSAQEQPARAAVKILRVDEEESPGINERFLREIEVLRQLKHDHIVRMYESGEYQGRPYLVMEYVDGLSLDQVLTQRGKLHWEEVIAIGRMVASALRYAHRQEVIHRDIKPANLLASWDRVVKLTDFGIAKLMHNSALTKDRTVIGTASYLSPEQAGGKPATRKSDLYSLGVVLYELVTGRLPFEAATDAELLHKHRYGQYELPSRLVEEIPADFDQLIASLLEKDPEKRPPNALAVEDVLHKIRRKYDRKRQYTPTPAAAPTKVMARDEEELEEGDETLARNRRDERNFPWFQAILLVGGLVGLFGLYNWLRQPPSVETLISRLESHLREGEWDQARKQLEEITEHYSDAVGQEGLKDLQARVESVKSYQQAKVQAGPFTFAMPRSQGEFFYRRGVILFFEGRVEEAWQAWRALIQAYQNRPSEGAWVRLADEALKQSEGGMGRSVQEALKGMEQLSAAARKERINHLRRLYETLPASPFRQEVLERLSKMDNEN